MCAHYTTGTISFSVTEPVVSGAEPVQLLYYKVKGVQDGDPWDFVFVK